jgi:hypothetical protein
MIQIVSHASFVKRNKRSKVSSKTSNLGTFKNASACKKCLAKVKIELQDYIEEKKNKRQYHMVAQLNLMKLRLLKII